MMMKYYALVLPLLLASCNSRQPPPAKPKLKPIQVSLPVNASKKPTILPIPADKAQLRRLLAMGYKIHMDHLDPPGVSSCPKMSENPVR